MEPFQARRWSILRPCPSFFMKGLLLRTVGMLWSIYGHIETESKGDLGRSFQPI